MLLKQSSVGINDCGFILKPFDEPFLLKPQRMDWIVIPLIDCVLSDGAFSVTCNTTFSIIPMGEQVSISGKAILCGVGKMYLSRNFVFEHNGDSIEIDRQDLYTSKMGITVDYHSEEPYTLELLKIVAAFYHLSGVFTENEKFFWTDADYRWEIEQFEQSSTGIKTGQFIL